MINFKFWIFNFDFSSLIAFLAGIFAGFALLGLIYSIMALASLKRKKYIVNTQTTAVTDEEIKEIIENSKKAFTDKNLKGAKSSISHCSVLCKNMVMDIARKFYPKSKRPIAELSVDEVLQLLIYISKRIDDILDRPALRLLKRTKLSTILALGDAKKIIEESSLMKLTKKYKLKSFFKAIKGALNVINPINWTRRLVVNRILDNTVNKLCVAIIGIAGEEAYKIYSKRVFNEERYIDANVEEIISSMEDDLVEVSEGEVDEYLSTQGLEEKIKRRGNK